MTLLGIIYLVVLSSVITLALSSDSELICPDFDPGNCYSRLFEPSTEWQMVKPGQVIPAGLDVRMDLGDSNSREARILRSEDSADRVLARDKAVIVADSPETIAGNPEDRQEFTLALGTIIRLYDERSFAEVNEKEVEGKLEILAELGSDIDFGVEIAMHADVFLAISGLTDDDEFWKSIENNFDFKDRMQELGTLCLSSALRNNEEALKHFSESFVDMQELLEKLMDASSNQKLLTRRLGLLGALIVDDNIEEKMLLPRNQLRLLNLYGDSKEKQLQSRILNVLEDLKLKRGQEEQELYAANDDERFAHMAQCQLERLDNIQGDEQGEILLYTLSKLAGKFKAQPEFLNWLNDQIEIEKRNPIGVSKRDTSKGYTSHLDYLIELRHLVFGNRLGMRKAYADEL
ncbi:hypothetical protein FOA43_002605 [Brettanomyces nanus]|uniref:Nucleotide exchange factor SIL1 n=1 Tax=Eeniella nana TaxID=13502 RepID=A0A875S4F9_EENNA|nr:uncharacterized protein FOA43_002605 [Brettanomyces nanus]QPG75255.1 hypothetical protein FOA43_002605 [Brettanomyces nanus]